MKYSEIQEIGLHSCSTHVYTILTLEQSMRMSPGKLLSEPSFTVTPLKPEEGKKYNYGAVIDDLDLSDINGMKMEE